jgi:hypothetical protein
MGGERLKDRLSAAGVFSTGRCGDDPSLGSPGGSERTRTTSKELLGGNAFGLGFCEVGGQVCRHLLGERIRYTESPPLQAALLDKITHEAPRL